jgi:hypothetical protein
MDIAEVEYNNEKMYLSVVSEDTEVSSKGFTDLDVKAIEGGYFEKGDRGKAIIGYRVAKKVFDKELHLRNSIQIKGKKFKVSG